MRSRLITPPETPRFFFKTIFLLVMITTVFSCKKGSDSAPVDTAVINIVNAAPEKTSISIFVDNLFVNGPELFLTDQSQYIPIAAGSRKFDITTGSSTQILLTQTLAIKANTYYSLFFTGQSNAYSFLLLSDDLSDPPAGKAKIRFLNLCPDGKSIGLGIKGGAVLFPAVAFKVASDFITIDPATYTLQLNTSENGSRDIPSVQLTAGKVYTVYAKGLVASTSVTDLGGQVIVNR